MRKFKKTYLVIIAAIDNCFETLDSRNFSTKKYAEKFARERTEKLSQIAKIYTPNNEFAYFF